MPRNFPCNSTSSSVVPFLNLLLVLLFLLSSPSSSSTTGASSHAFFFGAAAAQEVHATSGSAATAVGAVTPMMTEGGGGEEGDRRGGDDAQMVAHLQQHLDTVNQEKVAERIATRRRIHAEHMAAHAAIDPDEHPEISESTRQRFLDSRQKLLLRNGGGGLGFGQGLLLCGIVGLPILAFVVYQKF